MDEIRPLLQKHHYLGAKTADPMWCFAMRKPGGLFGDTGEPLAGIVYASPINRYFGTGCVELTRLVRGPELDIQLSQFVAWSLRWLRKNTDILYCLSYADAAAGHHGGIYQALSFDYVAESAPRPRWMNPITGHVVSGRSFDQRRPSFREGWERVTADRPKYLYVKGINERREKLLSRFGWSPLAYPKPRIKNG